MVRVKHHGLMFRVRVRVSYKDNLINRLSVARLVVRVKCHGLRVRFRVRVRVTYILHNLKNGLSVARLVVRVEHHGLRVRVRVGVRATYKDNFDSTMLKFFAFRYFP